MKIYSTGNVTVELSHSNTWAKDEKKKKEEVCIIDGINGVVSSACREGEKKAGAA